MTTPLTETVPDGVTVADTLDCSGLLCPLPVYKAALALARLAGGDVLRLVTTDPGALEDIPAMARQRGDTLLASLHDESTQVFFVRKGGAQ